MFSDKYSISLFYHKKPCDILCTDVPVNERQTTNWWAPVKKVGSVLDKKPDFGSEESEMERQSMLSGYTGGGADYYDISYSDEDWVDDIRV